MKQMLKRLKSEKGFTLVELLAVIVILGIILAIAIPAIGSVMDSAKEDTEANQSELILDAARLADVNGDLETDSTIGDLVTNGYLEKNDITTLNTDVGISKSDGNYTLDEDLITEEEG